MDRIADTRDEAVAGRLATSWLVRVVTPLGDGKANNRLMLREATVSVGIELSLGRQSSHNAFIPGRVFISPGGRNRHGRLRRNSPNAAMKPKVFWPCTLWPQFGTVTR
jgi:hypothetical protein